MTLRKILLSAGLLIVIGAMGWGFYLTGSPAHNRKIMADTARTKDLAYLSQAIDSYAEREKALPQGFEDLENEDLYASYRYSRMGQGEYYEDPVTGQPYAYSIIGEKKFKLCAVFEIDTIENPIDNRQASSGYYKDVRFSEHRSGEHCFSLEADWKDEERN